MNFIKRNMKSFKNFVFVVIAVAFLSAAAPVENTYILSKNYTVTINGTSNLHNWNEKVETVSGSSVVGSNSDGSFDLTAVNIKMNVHSIKSDMGSVMDNNTYKALKADANPEIIFTLTAPVKSIQTKASEPTVSAKGNLTIAGVTKPVNMQVKVYMQEHGKLAFEGSQAIKMTDYGINPPTALFGTMKTGNEITINFVTNFTTAIN